MRLDVRMINLEGSRAVEEHVRRRVGNALDHLSHRIRGGLIRIWDENGPRGGVDKRCQVVVLLHPSGEVIVEEDGGDVYSAVDRVTKRLKKSVRRGIERRCGWRGRKGERGGKGGAAA